MSLHRRTPAQVDATHAIDLGDYHHQLVPDRDDVLDARHAVVSELADVDQPLLAGQDLDEGAEVHDPGHLAQVLLANLDVSRQALDPADRLLRRLAGGGCDLDGAVVLDVDLGARLGGDLADHLAAGADHVADLVDGDLHGVDARRVGRQLAAAGADHRGHLVQDEEPANPGLLERITHDLGCDAGDLDVHLQRRHTLRGPGHLEVHVTVAVFLARDVGEHRIASGGRIGDEPHRHATHWRLDRDTGIHQRQGAAAG